MSISEDIQIRGIEMTEKEIEDFLTEKGYGTLSVASEKRAYSVPISIGYDGNHLFMNLLTFGRKSKKMDYLQDTEEACVVAMEINNRFDWRSVVVTGHIDKVGEDEEDYHEDVLNENGWFPIIYPPSGPLTDVARVVMEPTEMSGRKGEEYQH